jgi:hypothetical protein
MLSNPLTWIWRSNIHAMISAERIRSGTPYPYHKSARDLKDQTATFVGVAWTVLFAAECICLPF